MAIRIYGDFGSQPTRAVLALCKLNNVPYTFINVSLLKKEQKSTEYSKINPLKYIPAIVDETADNFTLFESHAILRYICRTKKVADNWYNYKSDAIIQAKIDRYLDWHHLNLRLNGSSYFANKILKPMLGIKPVSAETLQIYEKNLQFALKIIDQVFLQNNSQQWLAGTEEMTIADLSCGCELVQLFFLEKFDFKNFPNIQKFLLKFFENQMIKDVHKPFFKTLSQMNPDGAEKFQIYAQL